MFISDVVFIDWIGQDSIEYVCCGMQLYVLVMMYLIDLCKNYFVRFYCLENGCLVFSWDMQDGIFVSICFCFFVCIGDLELCVISQCQLIIVFSLVIFLGIENGLVEQQVIFNEIGDFC